MAKPATTIEFTLRGRILAWLAALAAGASWLADDANARIAAAMLAAPLLVDFVAKQRRLHQTVLSLPPRRTAAGSRYTEHVLLSHLGRSTLRECLLTEPRTMRTEPPALLPTVPRGAPTTFSLRQCSLTRCHQLERVFLLESSWPLGLFRARAVCRVTADLVTEPARVPLSAEVVQAASEVEVAPQDRSPLPGPEFHSLREHRLDDEARGVHALRSAATGTLVRRVTHGRVPRTVGVVLDLRRPPGRALHQGVRRFEWSLGACASLVAHLRGRGAELRVLVIATEAANFHVRGPAQELELLTLLAEAGPSPHRSVPGEQFEELRRLAHCYWIPAGAYLASPEFAAMPGSVTLVGGDFE
ncbi:MAG: DUF58 domain-containing protein [Planctomycetes bacterium]|nr:DUF58 domain-containing protein [Planctomycetota bacterium]